MFQTPDPNQKKLYCGGDVETALNICLGNLVNLSARAQAFHWNVEGPEFHQYHQFFRVVYEDLYQSIDGFAENILMAGYSLPMSLKNMLIYSTLQCDDVEPTPESLSRSLYESNKKCLEEYAATLELAESLGKDLGFVSSQIELQKKWDWQLRSIIKDADKPSPTSVTHINVDIEVEVEDESDKSGALNKIFRQELDPTAYDPMLASALVPEEKALEEALRQIVREHGKFDEDGTGVWAGYTPASENQDASIGVKCENCVFFFGEGQCEIIALAIEPEGKCRFAVLPEGVVNTEQVLERDFNILEIARTAAGGHQAPAEILFDPETEEELKKKVEKFNERTPRKLSFSTLKAVYRRGALSYPDVNRSGRSRDEWAMDRAKAFMRLFSAGKSSNSAYTHDNDLLPPDHPEFFRSEATLLASGQSVENSTDYAEYVKAQLQPDIRRKTSDYTSVSDAILSVVEISGLGYGAEVAFKAAWMRAINEGADPYARVRSFAVNTYNSIDADLLPEKKVGGENG